MQTKGFQVKTTENKTIFGTQKRSKSGQGSAIKRPKLVQVLAVAPANSFTQRQIARLKARHHMHLTFCDNAYDCLMLSDAFSFDVVVFFGDAQEIQPFSQIIRNGKAMQGRRAVYVSLGYPAVEGITDVQIERLNELPVVLAEWPMGGSRH
ncbi:MAG: hypothetical protein GC134_06760 [Proteobacteria bacterium]|nr:hypothetical protein [Pseudomonadota bacterium]